MGRARVSFLVFFPSSFFSVVVEKSKSAIETPCVASREESNGEKKARGKKSRASTEPEKKRGRSLKVKK